MKHWLEVLRPSNCQLIMQEIDLLRDKTHDLSELDKQKEWLLKAEQADVIISTPPCSDFSRAKWANSRGPPPLRNKLYPRGFPWLSTFNRSKVEMNNNLIQFNWKLASQTGKTKWQLFLSEHPEDLGRMPGGEPFATPASIWQSKEFQDLWEAGWWSGAFRQCEFGADTPKPTRMLASDHVFACFAPNCLPQFDSDGFYTGPVERCDHNHTVSLIRKPGDTGPFRTAEAAAYPSEMCKKIAQSIWFCFSFHTP